MANVTIGTVTPHLNPSDMTLVEEDKLCATKLTYAGVVYFSWPVSIVGKTIDIIWDEMYGDEYANMRTLFATDGEVVFNPNDGKGHTYNVNITKLTGKYLIGLDDSSSSIRQNVKMQIVIMSQAT